MRWTTPDDLTPTRAREPEAQARGNADPSLACASGSHPAHARCLIPGAAPPPLDPSTHSDLLDAYLNPDIPPRELAEIFSLSLAQLAAWAASPRTRADIDAINALTAQRAADLAPAQLARARHTLAAIATTAPGAKLSPLECRANETARKAAARLLSTRSPSRTSEGWASSPPTSITPPSPARRGGGTRRVTAGVFPPVSPAEKLSAPRTDEGTPTPPPPSAAPASNRPLPPPRWRRLPAGPSVPSPHAPDSDSARPRQNETRAGAFPLRPVFKSQSRGSRGSRVGLTSGRRVLFAILACGGGSGGRSARCFL